MINECLVLIPQRRRFILENTELPMGFGIALAMNPKAMEKFALLPESKKQEIISGTHSVTSKEEMHRYVEKIVSMQ